MQKSREKRVKSRRLPSIIFVTGPSGAGKSTLARALAKELAYQLLSLDVIREKYRGDTGKAWLEIWARAKRGKPTVIDATGASKIFRLVFRAVSFRQLRPVVVKLTADERVLGIRRSEVPSAHPHIALRSGLSVTERYLNEAAEFLPGGLEIDTTNISPRAVFYRALGYVSSGAA